MAKRVYEVIRVATTAFNPSPETVLSRHTSYDAARKAFNGQYGNIRLVEISGTKRQILDASLV